jgi:hypothetical protein
MTTVCNPLNGRVIDKGADNRLGNWSYVTPRGQTKNLTFITVYKITDVTLQQSTHHALTGGRYSMRMTTPQTRILWEEGKEPCSLSGLCKDEIRNLILGKFNLEDHELVIGMDANEYMTVTSATSLRLTMADLGLSNAL